MHKKVILGLAIIWTILIFILCLFSFSKLPSFGVSGTDKYVHFIFHFGFTLLWGHYFWLSSNELKLGIVGRVVLMSFCFGLIIEFLQEAITTTRHADVLDVLANSLGSLVAFLVFFPIAKYKSEK